MNNQSKFLIVGNKVLKMDTQLDPHSYTKLIIEVKSAEFNLVFDKKTRPRIIISQPVASIQNELKQLMLYN